MASGPDDTTPRFDWARKLALLGLLVCVVGLPLNGWAWFALLVVAAVLIFAGRVRRQRRSWALACVLVVIVMAAQLFLAPPRIDEGHNVFLVDEKSKALTTALPPDLYRLMAMEFDKVYPPEKRCKPDTPGCWRAGGFPDRAFAFSADGLYDAGASRGSSTGQFSRRVSDIDFDDPVWLRLGFTNELRYNWVSNASDVKRLRRDGRFWAGVQRWHLLMPYFVMYRFPAAYAGSQLCWNGDVIWEERPDRFTLLSNASWACRAVEASDIGNRVFGLGIRPGTLAMTLDPPVQFRMWQWSYGLLKILVMVAVIGLLLRQRASVALPLALIAMSFAVITIHDASFLGGWRPLDSGDEGLVYESGARAIVQSLMSGDIWAALKGSERFLYYNGQGLLYLRAVERFIFGDTNLGYLAAVLSMPIVLIALYRRFLPARWALVLGLIFVAVPIGAIFGTSFVHYSRWAARGFADPAAAIAALCAVTVLVGRTQAGPHDRFGSALGAGFLLALAVFIRPNIAPFCAVMLAGAGFAGFHARQWRRIAGLCLGFLPVIAMPLHYWTFASLAAPPGDLSHALIATMPPAAWLAAAGELLRLHLNGEHLVRGVHQIMNALAGPSGQWVFAPLHLAALILLVHVVVRGRGYDPWLRLIATAAVVQHAMLLFFIPTPRYHFITWLMTALVVAVWLHRVAPGHIQRRWPNGLSRWRAHPLNLSIDSGLRRLEHAAGMSER